MSWSPNQWDVKVQVSRPDVLVVNQNYDPGWRTIPSKKLINVGGLLGVEVTTQDGGIVFYYLPFNLMLGLGVSLLGMMAIGWDVKGVRDAPSA